MQATPLLINLLILQGLFGAFDTLYHHEFRIALPRQVSAALELRIHAIRSVLYGVVFLGLAWFQWGGFWSLVLFSIVVFEFILTFWDFLIEDRTRLLPASERITHTVLAINGGAILALLALQFPLWWALPSSLHFISYHWQSVVLSLFAFGVVFSGVRDAIASDSLFRRQTHTQLFSFSVTPKRILVTGGTGFIGQKLCHALLANGHDLILLTRNPLKTAYLFSARVRCIRDFDELASSTAIDIVINLAGERIVGLRWTKGRREKLLSSRVDTTIALVAWIARAQHKPRLMLSASAVGYYGIQSRKDKMRLDENSPPQSIFMSKLCQRWEAVAKTAEQYDVPVAILRFGLVFGHDGVLPLMQLPFLLGIGGRLGDGQQVMSWIHIDDVLGAIAFLINKSEAQPVHGTYNFTSPETVQQAEFTATLAKVLHRPNWLPMPAAPIRFLLGEQASLMLEGQRVYPAMLEQLGYQFLFPRLDLALRNLRDH